MITHLESDILDHEVKWHLQSITMNKGGWWWWWNSSWVISNEKLIFRRIDKESVWGLKGGRGSGPLRRKKGSGVLKEKWTFFFSALLCLPHIRWFFLNSELLWQRFLWLTFFNPRANDYTTKQLILFKGMCFFKPCTDDNITIVSYSRTCFSFITRTFWLILLY